MESHVVLLKESIFKSRYGKWYLIHTQNSKQRILIDDARTVQLLLKLFSGTAIKEVASNFGIAYSKLMEFLVSLKRENVIGFSEMSTNSLDRCYDVDPPIDSLNILITNACNLHCAHCYVGSGRKMKGELTGTEWIKVLEQARRLGVFGINVSGGEPLIHGDFCDIADYIATVPTFHANLNTNGTQFYDGIEEAIVRAFASVQVSIDDSVASKHDEFRGLKGCFQKTVMSIKRLIVAGTEVNVGFTLTRHNLASLRGMVDWCESMGITALNIGLVSDIGRAHRNKLVGTVNEITIAKDPFWEHAYHELRELAARHTTLHILLPFRINSDHGEISVEKQYICDGDDNQILYIMADGTIMPCDKLPMQSFGYGNVRVNSLLDTWVSERMCAFKLKSPRDLPKCKHCPYLKTCGGACVARAFCAGGSLNAVDWTSCVIAQKFVKEQS